MKHRKQIAGILFALTAVLAVVGYAAATSPGGTGPDDALTPAGDWQPLGSGESRWYAFEYAGDGSQVEVRVEVTPAGSAAFAVWTPEEIRRWGLGLEVEPVGRGSADPFAAGSLVWSGSFTTAGTYYVVVERAGSGAGTSYYLLTVRGDGVSLSKPAPTATPRPQPATPQPKVVAPPAATSRLVFQTTIGGPFYTIRADGTALTRITDGMDPTWSPDGRQIAFTRWREPRGVWVVNADGSGEWRVFDWSEARWPSWSPAQVGGSAAGTRLLFSRQYGGRTEEVTRCFWGFCFTVGPHPHWKLGIVRLADGDFREPPCSDYSLAPSWSPVPVEGSAGEARLVYADEQGLRVQSEDGTVSSLITHDSRDTGPAWSPDGKRLAFTRRQHDHWEVYVVDVDGRNLKRLTTTPLQPNGALGNSAAPAWSPDGQYLAFLTDRSGKWEIWLMRADGSGQKPMFQKGVLAGVKLEYAGLGERAISWTR
jgi:WD40-like Beta Propeller Repeat